jgi:hypothetical protein
MLPTKKLVSAMAGLAMMALPVSAMAADHHHNWNQGNGQFAHSQSFARRPAAVQNQFVHNQAVRNPFPRSQARPGLDWSHGFGFGSHPNYARNYPGSGWNHPNYASNHPNWQNWGYRPHNNGNWMANNYRDYDVPPSGCGAVAQQVNPYAPPPGAFAFNQPYLPAQSNCPNSNYGYGLGNGYSLGNVYSYANPYSGGSSYGNGYFGGNLMALRDRLLQERAGAYQQLAVRERNGDRNGAHHLWNTIHSLNQQLSRVNSSINRRG